MEQVTPTRANAVDAPTMAHAFRATAEQFAEEPAIRTLDDSISWTWGELERRAIRLAGGLQGLGLQRGQCYGMLLTSRPEFHLCDIAGQLVGATPFSIYLTAAPDQIAFVVDDAEARILITEQAFLPNVLAARDQLPNLEHIVVVDGDAPEGTIGLAEVTGDFDVDSSLDAIEPSDIVTLIYTSGTTGPPKGVEITHNNIMSAVRATQEIIEFPTGCKVISWLPNAHIAERTAHLYVPIVYGANVTTCPDPKQIAAVLQQVKPNWFFAVPRVWEKIKSGLEAMVQGMPEEQRVKAQGALDASIQRVRLQQAGEPVPEEIEAIWKAADEQMFGGLRAMLGLDEALAINVGAAPTPVPVLEFFHALGLPLAELWGMSETCGAGAVNHPERIKLGTVGQATPGCELKLADDGELLMRGAVVFGGYRNAPEKTAEALDADGWLHTGDVAEIDEDGFVTLVDRKKELIINAAGKNMSPSNIEAELKSSSPLIGAAVCIGDARAYNTALIVLDSDFAPVWAAQNELAGKSLEELSSEPSVRAQIEAAVEKANERLSRVEQIKKFTIIEGEWLPGGDELTPTMKLRRKPIDEKYSAQIEAMYGSEASAC